MCIRTRMYSAGRHALTRSQQEGLCYPKASSGRIGGRLIRLDSLEGPLDVAHTEAHDIDKGANLFSRLHTVSACAETTFGLQLINSGQEISALLVRDLNSDEWVGDVDGAAYPGQLAWRAC